MVEKKVPSKLGIQADHVNSDKHFANLKLSSSQHKDGKSKGTDKKKSGSIKLSNLKTLLSSPSRRSLSQLGKPPPLHVSTNAASPQKQEPLVRRTHGSPNYMKPISSSDAKKELSPVTLRNIQSGSDGKNQPQKNFSSNLKAGSVSCKKPAKTLTRSFSLNMARTLTKSPSFKQYRKSARAAVGADMNAPERATCSSTLKDSKFPAYLMLNPGDTESEGTSVMRVCPYTYCSLNCHHDTPLPPLKSFTSARRHLLRTQKSMNLEPMSRRRLEVTCETTTNEFDIEKNVLDGKSSSDEADTGNPIINPLVQEISLDFFIEIYAKEKEEKPAGADKMEKLNPVKDVEDGEDIKITIEKNGIAAGEDGVKQVIPCVRDAPPKSQIDLEEGFKKYFDDIAVEVDTQGSFLQEQNAEDADKNRPSSWFHEEISMGSHCSGVSYDGEHRENIEMDDSDLQATDTEWEEEQLCAFNHEDDIDSSVFIEIYAKEMEAKPTGDDEMEKFDYVRDLEDQEDNKPTNEDNGIAAAEDGVKQVIPSVRDAPPKSEIDLEKDFKKCFDDVANKADAKGSFLHEQNAEGAGENHPSSWVREEINVRSYCSEVSYDGEHMENIETDDSDPQVTDMGWEEEQFCAFDQEEDTDSSVFGEEQTDSKAESLSGSLHYVSLDDILSSYYEDILVEEALQEANAEEGTCIEAPPHDTHSVMESTSGSIETQETEYLFNSISCDQSSLTEEVFRHLTNAEDGDIEIEKHLDDEASCTTKVLDEETLENTQGHKTCETCEIDKTSKESNPRLQNSDETISQENRILSSDVPEESTTAVQDQEILEVDQGKANKFQSTSCMGAEEQNTSKSWKVVSWRKRHVQDDEEMRRFNPREPNFLPLVPDPEVEIVDLKHQVMDERKNAEEWMLDYALRQAVTKLAPARKSKVALLVEAFETVMSIPKCETHMRNNSDFAHARPIQACS